MNQKGVSHYAIQYERRTSVPALPTTVKLVWLAMAGTGVASVVMKARVPTQLAMMVMMMTTTAATQQLGTHG